MKFMNFPSLMLTVAGSTLFSSLLAVCLVTSVLSIVIYSLFGWSWLILPGFLAGIVGALTIIATLFQSMMVIRLKRVRMLPMIRPRILVCAVVSYFVGSVLVAISVLQYSPISLRDVLSVWLICTAVFSMLITVGYLVSARAAAWPLMMISATPFILGVTMETSVLSLLWSNYQILLLGACAVAIVIYGIIMSLWASHRLHLRLPRSDLYDRLVHFLHDFPLSMDRQVDIARTYFTMHAMTHRAKLFLAVFSFALFFAVGLALLLLHGPIDEPILHLAIVLPIYGVAWFTQPYYMSNSSMRQLWLRGVGDRQALFRLYSSVVRETVIAHLLGAVVFYLLMAWSLELPLSNFLWSLLLVLPFAVAQMLMSLWLNIKRIRFAIIFLALFPWGSIMVLLTFTGFWEQLVLFGCGLLLLLGLYVDLKRLFASIDWAMLPKGMTVPKVNNIWLRSAAAQ